ncbi:MAG: hypothetical protein ACPG4X_22515 [Pikeienuella sp.]
MLQIDLPKPISVNGLFSNGASGRVKTKRYRTWCDEAWVLIQSQKPFAPISGPVRLLFAIGEVGVSPKADGDNMLKAYIDALVTNGILPEDNRTVIRGVGMEWVAGKEGATAYIMPASGVATAMEAPADNWRSIGDIAKDMVRGQIE